MNFCLYSIKISGFRVQVMPISGLCTVDVGVLPRLNAKSPGTRAQPEFFFDGSSCRSKVYSRARAAARAVLVQGLGALGTTVARACYEGGAAYWISGMKQFCRLGRRQETLNRKI